MITIKEITAADTYAIRQAVLRIGKPIETCLFPGDDFSSTKHFGIHTDKLIGVISLYENKNGIFTNETQYQIRGMAILEDFQGLGLGEKLITYSEKQLLSEKGALIWFNARQNAVGFYKKLGYKIMGGAFEINDVGTHYVMYKKLGN
jgi:ribosomal protein S18 acetylase RimI-like enzyme